MDLSNLSLGYESPKTRMGAEPGVPDASSFHGLGVPLETHLERILNGVAHQPEWPAISDLKPLDLSVGNPGGMHAQP